MVHMSVTRSMYFLACLFRGADNTREYCNVLHDSSFGLGKVHLVSSSYFESHAHLHPNSPLDVDLEISARRVFDMNSLFRFSLSVGA